MWWRAKELAPSVPAVLLPCPLCPEKDGERVYSKDVQLFRRFDGVAQAVWFCEDRLVTVFLPLTDLSEKKLTKAGFIVRPLPRIAELCEFPSGPPLTNDDLLALHNELAATRGLALP